MSASQFDDILGEFGDSASTPAKISSVAASDEDFDPYGPSHGGEQSADLLDFSSDSEIKRRDTSNGIDSDFDATTSSYSAVMTTDAPSSGLLFDLDTETGANQPSGQHYEFSEEATTTSRTTNLLEDVDNDGTTGEAAEELNVPAGTSLGEPGDVDFLQADEPHNVRGDLLGGSDEEHGYEPEILNGHPMLVSEPHFVDEEEKYLVQVQDSGEEEVTHEDNEASRTTDAGNRYSDYEPEQTQTAEDQSEFTSRIASESTSAQQKQADIQREAYHEKQSQQLLDDEEEEEGIYENQPSQRRDDVARETDTNRAADLPSTGTAQSMREKFLAAQKETRTAKREITPPIHGAGGEYVSEPRGYVEKYEGRAESGVFESQPAVNVDVINAGTSLEEAKYEAGHAKSTAAKFVELQSKSYTPSGKRELTPDRTGRVEYVSEPRGHFEKYEGKSESGVFESEPVVNPDVIRAGEEVKEELPERGTAKNIAEKFRQITSESTSPSAGSKGKREITPDRSGRVEYVSEPRGQRTEDYEVRVDAGVFENQPLRNDDIITSESVAEEFVPERGYAKNVAAKFKELETNVKSPPSTPGRRKEFTPPREDERFHLAGVVENNPDFKTDVVHSGDQQEEALPERGTAKNIAERFRQLETESKIPVTSRPKREFTPPPGDAGVYENQPKQFQADYNRPPESGIIENQPLKRDDVIRGDEPPKYEEELPERGAAKNLVNRWKQLESESSKVKSPGSGRPKEFTPPREEPRIAEQRKSPCTPLSPSGNEQLDNGSVHPSDLPGQYQPQNEPSVFESTPQAQRSDVLKEGDNDWTEGMPKKNTAKKMLAKFQNIQAEASKQSPGPVSHKAKDVRNK